jgi:hypothetical protein
MSEPAKTNSARRIYEILTTAYNHPAKAGGGPTGLTLTMWGEVLGGPLLITPEGPGSRQYEDAIVPLLMEVRREIDSVDAALRSKDDYRALVAPLIEGASRITGTAFLHQDWNGVKAQHFQPALASGWGLLAAWIPATDPTLTEEQLSELVRALEELEEAGRAPELPPALRVLIRGQVDALRAALLRYRVSGTEQLRKAVATGVGELQRERASLEVAVQAHPESAKTAIDKLKKVWKLGAEMCGDLDNYAKGYALYHVAK